MIQNYKRLRYAASLLMMSASWLWPASVSAAEGKQSELETYKNPIVFARAHLDEATGNVIHGAKLWLMEEDGSRLKQLTEGTDYDDHPSLFADLRTVLYAEYPDDPQSSMRLVYDSGRPVFRFQGAGESGAEHGEGSAAEGRRARSDVKLIRLDIYTGAREVYAHAPGCRLHHAALSPVGDRLVYHRDCKWRRSVRAGWGPDTFEISMAAANGVALADSIIFQHEKNVFEHSSFVVPPDLPPRGVSLVRLFGHGKGARALFLTGDSHLNRRPAVSPDGTWLAWQSNATGEDEIFLSKVDGTEARNLTRAKGRDGHPWFTRDGKWVVFESDRSGTWEIWRLHIDSGRSERLTFGGRRYSSRRPRT